MDARKQEESTTVGLNVMMNEWSIYSECVSYVFSNPYPPECVVCVKSIKRENDCEIISCQSSVW